MGDEERIRKLYTALADALPGSGLTPSAAAVENAKTYGVDLTAPTPRPPDEAGARSAGAIALEIIRAHKGTARWLDPANDKGHLATFNSFELHRAIAEAIDAERLGTAAALAECLEALRRIRIKATIYGRPFDALPNDMDWIADETASILARHGAPVAADGEG